MGIRFGSSDPGNNLRVGTQTVGGMAIGSTVVYRRPTRTPTRDLYMVDSSNLYVVDATTGRATRIGTSTLGISSPSGLANRSGSLYTIDTSVKALYRISTGTGRATRVGSVSNLDVTAYVRRRTQFATVGGVRTAIPINVTQVTPQSITSHGGTLYASIFFAYNYQISSLTRNGRRNGLFTINASNGEVDSYVSITSGSGAHIIFSSSSIVSHSGSLQIITSGGSLYRINTGTGEATRQYSVTNPGGLASRGGVLYGAYSNGLYTISSSGRTRVGSASSYGVGVSSPAGLTNT